MRVAILQDDFPPQSFGGAGISTYELAKGIQNAGYDVFVVTTVRNKSEAGEYDFEGLKIFKIASNYHEGWRAYLSLYNPLVIRELKKIFARIQPDIVHVNNVHYYLSYYSIKLAKKMAKNGVVMTFRDAMAFSFGKLQTKRYLESFDSRVRWYDQLKQAGKRWNPFRNIIIQYFLGFVDKRLAVSNVLKSALEQNGIKDVEVMHTGISLDEYAPSEPPNKKVVLYGGRPNNKTKEIVEQAMARLPEATLVIAGGGGKWLGREEIKEAYRNADVVLVPSVYFDAFPRMVLEAMASARPVIGSLYGGAGEALLDGATGYIVDSRDPQKLAEKIVEFLNDPTKAREFGQAGRRRIETNFNLSDKIDKLISVYERLS